MQSAGLSAEGIHTKQWLMKFCPGRSKLKGRRESVNDPCAETFCVPQPGLEFTVPLQGGLMVTVTLLTQPPE